MLYRLRRRMQKIRIWLCGFLSWHVVLPWVRITKGRIGDLNHFERRITSQNWEDGIIHAVFGMIGTTNRHYVEFGVENGTECNTRQLRTCGWTGLLMDGGHENASIGLRKEFITAENIEALFQKHNVPTEFDLLSIDIDGNDYWVWKAIEKYQPRVVIIEYNACIPYAPAVTVPYKPDFQWDKTDYYGASLSALVILGTKKGYTLVATDSRGVNAFFVQNALAEKYFAIQSPETIYKPAMFKGKPGGHPHDEQRRPWTHLD